MNFQHQNFLKKLHKRKISTYEYKLEQHKWNLFEKLGRGALL